MVQFRHDLRDYQVAGVDQTIEALADRPILVAPTGSGKTVMATELVERLNRRTLWLAHRKELIEQAAARLQAHGLDVGIIKAGIEPTPEAQVQVASIATLLRREKPAAGLIVVDECHHAKADSYLQIFECYPGVPLVGLTATPFRLDGRGLGDIFGRIVVAAWPDDLCNRGTLHRPKVWGTPPPDLRGVAVQAGDFSLRELAKRTNTAQANADIVAMWRKHAAGRRTACFAVDIEHSQAITAAFRAVAIPAEHLDGRTPGPEREAILARLAGGETLVVCNCMVLTEGWDLPALECAVVARPTASLNLHLQMIGRIMRACPGKDGAIVLDHAGNHHRHGLVTRRLNYTLDSHPVGSDEPLGLRRCEGCGLYFENTLDECPECGWRPSPAGATRKRPDIHGDGEYVELDNSNDFAYRRAAWNNLELQRRLFDFKPGWSFFRYREEFNEAPLVIDGELVDAASPTAEQKRAYFAQLTVEAERRGYKRGWASHRYREAFGVWPSGFVDAVRSERVTERLERLLK